ncbi:MAG: 50S ribosomal protein L18 [Chloroflexota bacterium]
MAIINYKLARERRHQRVRAELSGTPSRMRLNVFRSLSHIYVQIIDDTTGRTMASACTLDADFDKATGKNKTEQAKLVGKLIAQRAVNKGINQVVFDRGGYQYHGRIKALAEAAREAGLKF